MQSLSTVAAADQDKDAVVAIDDNAAASDSDLSDADADADVGDAADKASLAASSKSSADLTASDRASTTTCLSPACCEHFAALTGLDIHAINRELHAARAASLSSSPSSPSSSSSSCSSSSSSARPHGRSAFEGGPDHKALHALEQKAMAVNRVDGPDELYVGGVFALRRPGALDAYGVTHILSMIKYSLSEVRELDGRYVHLSVDVDDVDDEDMLVHLPRAVRFIDRGLRGGDGQWPRGTVLPGARSRSTAETDMPRHSHSSDDDDDDVQAKTDREKPGAVFVHCAMGKSRSVTAVLAYLLWRYPQRHGVARAASTDDAAARAAVQHALDWVRRTRDLAEPNAGFMRQLAMWVAMGMPADGDDAVERHDAYRRWLWEREVRESAAIGRRPDWIRFEDEQQQQQHDGGGGGAVASGTAAKELRCKKCRRVLANHRFVIAHRGSGAGPCAHHFVEALSWMRPTLEGGALDGRLACPNARCGALVGRYAWQGLKCSCDEWVCPAFSLSTSRVDEVAERAQGGGDQQRAAAAAAAALGIRLPPGRQNL